MIKKTMTLSLLLVLVSGCATPSRLKKYGLEMYEKGAKDAWIKGNPLVEEALTQRDRRIQELQKSLDNSSANEDDLKHKIETYLGFKCSCKHKAPFKDFKYIKSEK